MRKPMKIRSLSILKLEWLDDTIINSYGKMLQSQFPESIFVFDSHFLEKLQADGYDGV